jgi:hypothetical protein
MITLSFFIIGYDEDFKDFCMLCGKWEEAHKKDFDHVFQSIKKRDFREQSNFMQEMFN